MRTKWEIMEARRINLLSQVVDIENHQDWAKRTPFKVSGSNEPGMCSQCGIPLATEADFEKHFVVPDERYTNLGVCPNKPTGK